MTRPKYGNQYTVVDGITFDSKREARHWQELRLRERAGEISGLRRQVPFVLAQSVVLSGRKKPALRWIADFVYVENGVQVVADSKGVETDTFRIKRHLMAAVHGVEIKLM